MSEVSSAQVPESTKRSSSLVSKCLKTGQLLKHLRELRRLDTEGT